MTGQHTVRSMAIAALVVCATLLLGLIAGEWVAMQVLKAPGERKAAQARIAWDRRDRVDVVMAQRRTDPDWFPAVPANTYLERPVHINGRRVVPLGGVALANVVGCNENGFFSRFTTDAHGFNNPRSVFDSPVPKMFFLGDSFTQGDCLSSEESVVGRVRAEYSGVVNLGSGGNGPLFELAGIREYVPASGATLVFWMYYEGNDLVDLRRDARDPLLARYLEPDFSQDLARRQPAINDAVRSMVEARLGEHVEARPRFLPNLRLLAWHARQNWARNPHVFAPASSEPEPLEDELRLFERILLLARDEVSKKGGTLVFVYLPEYHRYAGPQLSAGAAHRERVLAAVERLGIPTIDIHAEMSKHPSPVELFPFGLKGHYNGAGAALVSAELVRFIRRRGPPAL